MLLGFQQRHQGRVVPYLAQPPGRGRSHPFVGVGAQSLDEDL